MDEVRRAVWDCDGSKAPGLMASHSTSTRQLGH